MKKLILGLLFALAASTAQAQNPTCPTRPSGDNSNACASTAFVHTAVTTIPASSVIYTPPGTGGTSITQQAYDQRVLWAADYGAVCDGTTDDSTAFQNLINEAQTLGIPARFVGTCKINTGLSIIGSLDFSGFGRGLSVLRPAVGITTITINTLLPISLSNFDIGYSGANSSNKGIVVTGGTANTGSRFTNLFISLPSNGIEFDAADSFVVDKIIVNQFSNVGIAVANTTPDSGDSVITNSTLIGAPAASTGVFYQSSGGLRFENNKVNGTNLGSGFQLDLASGASTGDLLIVGNSFEGISNAGYGITMQRQSTTGGFQKVIISSNELGVDPLKCVYIPTDGTAAWITDITIIGNSCGTTNSASAIAFDIDSALGVMISGNALVSANASTKLIALGSLVTSCAIGVNAERGTFAASTGIAAATCNLSLEGLRSGASGGVPYFGAAGILAASSVLSANNPVIGGGAATAPASGSRSGNTTIFATTTGAQTSGDCVSIDASGNHIANGSPCKSGTVTSIATTTPITGGTITTTGTIACATCVTSAASLTSNSLVIGAGSQASAVTTTGTGVLTALGFNVGLAGAFITFNGALGTPSSGTVTNLTGTASININGTVGATTPGTGAFTTLSASGVGSFTNTTNASSNTTAGVVVSGGLAIGATKSAWLGTALIGPWPTSSTFAFFGTNALDQTVAGNFALLQGPTGDTYVNAAAGKSIEFRVNNVSLGSYTSSGLGVTGAFNATTTVKTGGYTVATLPAGTVGMMAYVTDQLTACAGIGLGLTGGGAITCPVFYNGTAWVSG